MAKRYLWVVEWKDDGVWIPLAMDGDWTRRHARRYASDLRKSVGSDATRAALGDIGIAFDDIRHQNPADQFVAIAHGIQSIEDPADQVRIAMELFGKSGADLLPTLKSDVDGLRNATVRMSEDSVKAWDDLGDAINSVYQNAKASIGDLLGSLWVVESSAEDK